MPAPQKTTSTINQPLEANSVLLDEAQELVHIGSWQWNVAGGNILWSDELYRIYGLKPQERQIGYEEFIQLIHPEDREKVNGIINEAYQTKRPFEFEHRVVLPNKKIRVLHGKGKVVCDKAGDVIRMLGTSQDITERKKADLALHRSNERFMAISAATNDVVYDIDLQANSLWFNDALNTAYKYPRRRIPYTPGWRLHHIHPDDQQRIQTSLDTLLTGKAMNWVAEYRFQTHDDRYIDIRDRAFVLRDAAQKPIRVIGSMLDITQQKELERAKDRFLSLVSHQLRTPLTSMRLLTEMLSYNAVEEFTDTQQDYLQKIKSSTVNMIHLVNEILSVSSIETGRLGVHTINTDMRELIQGQIDGLAPLALTKHTTISYTPSATPQIVLVDRMLFGQIVHNLLTNALRYTMADHSEVHVAFQQTKKDYLLTVSDRGIGIPKEAQAKIFTSFYRANNAIKVQGDGSGLGLYLAKLILDITGGKMWFESEEGKGSTFYVSLPLSGMKVQESNKV